MIALKYNKVFIEFWLPWYLYTLAIYVSSSISYRPIEIAGLTLKDFWVHPLEFMILALLTYRAFHRAAWQTLAVNYILLGFTFCVVYAMTDEFHQSWVPMRSGKWSDVFWDWLGVVMGTVVYGGMAKGRWR